MVPFTPVHYRSDTALGTASLTGAGFALCAEPVLQDGMAYRRAAALRPAPACQRGLVVA